MVAFACLKSQQHPLARTVRLHKTGVTPASAEMGADASLDIISKKQHKNLENRIKNANFRYKIVPKIQTDTKNHCYEKNI